MKGIELQKPCLFEILCYCDFNSLLCLTLVNHTWKRICENVELSDQLLHKLKNFNHFKRFMQIIFFAPLRSPSQKIIKIFLPFFEKQTKLITNIKNRQSLGLNHWQSMACIASLSSKNFLALQKENKHIEIYSLLNSHQKLAFINIFGRLLDEEKKINQHSLDKELINFIVLICVRKHLNVLLEFLLRIGFSQYYEQDFFSYYDGYPYLLTEKEDCERQHPVIACFDYENKAALQIFLSYTEKLFKIYNKFNCLSFVAPPLHCAAQKLDAKFIEMVAKQNPELLDQLTNTGTNIVHATLNVSQDYSSRNFQDTILVLHRYRPDLFFMKNSRNQTPYDLLPKDFFTNFRLDFKKS